MASNKNEDKDVQERLSKILAGAFSGPPTPLKAIPKKDGGKRSGPEKKASNAARNRPGRKSGG
jgi:hypothetical protein